MSPDADHPCQKEVKAPGVRNEIQATKHCPRICSGCPHIGRLNSLQRAYKRSEEQMPPKPTSSGYDWPAACTPPAIAQPWLLQLSPGCCACLQTIESMDRNKQKMPSSYFDLVVRGKKTERLQIEKSPISRTKRSGQTYSGRNRVGKSKQKGMAAINMDS